MKKKKTSTAQSVKVVSPAKTVKKQDRVLIFDTTLRDGEQSPGATMTYEEKLLIAEVLDGMGVDIIEAGFALASDGDFEAINEIARRTQNAAVCSLARAKSGDVERAAEAVKPARKPRIHTFISTSDIHIEHQLNSTRKAVLEAIADSVKLARNLCDDVEWSGMDASRSDPEFLMRAIEIAIKSGARTVNIPDTVGYTLPHQFYELITRIKNTVPNIDKAIISVHCHNDLGLATANSLAAVQAGARQIECTINGLGERAGNTSLEEVVMAIQTRQDSLKFKTEIDTTQIMRASRLVSSVTGFAVQNNKAIVGANAFAHESGIHQDGMLKNANTYEIMRPESVGWTRTQLVMGKHSGRHAFREKLKELGFNLGDNAFEDAFGRFKSLADKKKHVFDDDLIALVENQVTQGRSLPYQFVALEIQCGSKQKAKAALEMLVNGKKQQVVSTGAGPVDATFNAIKKLVPFQPTLDLYQVHAVTGGTDAQAEVTVRLTHEGRMVNGNAADTDTLVASALAYINAMNRIATIAAKVKPEKAALTGASFSTQ